MLGPSSVSALLAQDWSRARSAQSLRKQLQALASQGAALDLRLARLLVWFSRQDLAPLSYPSFTAFCRERVEWRTSWLRDLRRLVQSPLDMVKRAASVGEISLRVAVVAPGQITVEQQVAWLAQQEATEADDDFDAALHRTDLFIGEEALDIRAARERARVLIGKHPSTRAVDEYMILAWQDQRTAAELLEEARTPPPPPELTPGSWNDAPDPATALVGPWIPPRDLPHGIELLEELQAIRRGRIAALGLGSTTSPSATSTWTGVTRACVSMASASWA